MIHWTAIATRGQTDPSLKSNSKENRHVTLSMSPQQDGVSLSRENLQHACVINSRLVSSHSKIGGIENNGIDQAMKLSGLVANIVLGPGKRERRDHFIRYGVEHRGNIPASKCVPDD